jgi:hypothetical protein
MLIKAVVFGLLRITVVIYNSEAVPERELLAGETVAGQILRQAGVEVVWRQATHADTSPDPLEIPLHLLSTHPPNLGPAVSGFAILMPEGSYAGISYPAVKRTAHTLQTDDPTILGAVMAHELGHVLLGTRDHSSNGLMVMRFGPREIAAAHHGELLFYRSEARRIRAEVARRATISR